MDIVASSPRSTAARVLVETAVNAWRSKFPFCKVDDCAAVCLFFDSDSSDKLTPDAEASTDQLEQSSLLGEKGIGVEAEK